MILVGRIDREWHTVQTLAADHATEAFRMVRFAIGPQYTLENRFHAHRALFQRVQVVFFAARLPLERIEWFPLQIDLALTALEAVDVIDLLHGRATGIFADHRVATLNTRAEILWIRIVAAHVHRLHK